MARQRPEIVVETRASSAVAWSIGTTHKQYEDRYRMLSRDISLVEKAGRGEIFAVFDGIGSAPLGMRAAQHMADGLLKFFDESSFSSAPDGLSELLYRLNVEIFNFGCVEGADLPLGGCAGTIIWTCGNRLTVFHAGDTVGLLLHGEETIKLTRLHDKDGAIYRYFGLGHGLAIDSESYALEDFDRIVLMSDGITKVYGISQAAEIAMDEGDTLQAALSLASKAQSRGSPDDITVLVVDWEPGE